MTPVHARDRFILFTTLFFVGVLPTQGMCADRAAASPDSARALIAQERYAEAEVEARSLLLRAEAAEGKESAAVADALDLLTESLRYGGKSGDPETMETARRAVALREKLFGPEHLTVASSLSNLAIIEAECGDVISARPLFERALAIRRQNLGDDHVRVLAAQENLGVFLLHYAGDPDAARTLFEHVLARREALLGAEHMLVGRTLLNRATLYLETGEYASARADFERAVKIQETALGPASPELGMTLNNLGNLLREIGSFAEAQATLSRALEIREAALGPDHPDVAQSLSNLAGATLALGDPVKARSLFERALAIMETAFGPDHPHVADVLNGLADCHSRDGDHAGAVALLERALAIRDKPNALGDRFLALILNSLGREELFLGNVAGARGRIERALAIRREMLGPDHPDVAQSSHDLARVQFHAGETSRALDLAMRTEEIGRSSLSLVADRLAEPDALRYSSVRVSGLGLALTLLSSKQDAASVARVWDSLIHSRALVLEQVANRRNRLSRISDPEVARLEDHFDRAVRRLANLTVRGPGQEGPEQFRIRLDDARREKDSAERALASQSLSFREELRRREVGLEDVRRNLPRESALVGFCRFDEEGSSRPEAIPAYAAFILGTSGGEPRFVRLGSAREIDSLVTRWREAVSGQSSPACAAAGEALRRSIWDPLKTALGSARRASIVPDGSLNLVNLAALPAPGGGFLVETGPLIHYLSSERDLLPKDPVVTKDHGFLAVGGVDFDDSPSMHALAMGAGSAGTSGTSTLVTGSAHSFRGALPGCADFRNHRFESLPGTLREVEDVSDIWDESLARSSGTGSGERPAANRPEARALVLSRQAASEVAMKTLSRDRRVLHLATHGFFLGSRCSTRTDTGISKSRGVGAVASAGRSEDASLSFSENPLRLSGLALAGANHRDAAGPDEDDGILTAEEVAALDLSGTEWAVLSACETGVGEVWAGEGVLGLRRSFQVAGARTVIMSLWSVEDESAREWMKALYEARLSRGLGTAESAREASLAVLRGRRASGQSDNPFFWGNFVVAGDWR